jgi:serine protease Do
VRRGSIGTVRIEHLTPEYAQELGAPNTHGALVVALGRTSEAYRAGLLAGDVIVGFNGQVIDDPAQFARQVSDAKIGSTATVRVLREGRPVDLKLPIVSSAQRRTR